MYCAATSKLLRHQIRDAAAQARKVYVSTSDSRQTRLDKAYAVVLQHFVGLLVCFSDVSNNESFAHSLFGSCRFANRVSSQTRLATRATSRSVPKMFDTYSMASRQSSSRWLTGSLPQILCSAFQCLVSMFFVCRNQNDHSLTTLPYACRHDCSGADFRGRKRWRPAVCHAKCLSRAHSAASLHVPRRKILKGGEEEHRRKQ